MYFADLTPYVYIRGDDNPPALNVGWLDSAHEFPKGVVPAGFLARLRQLQGQRVHQTRGFQVCQFCPQLKEVLNHKPWTEEHKAFYQACLQDGRFSSAEFRVRGLSGRVYAAPLMLAHYVETHHYLPPDEFVAAVMQTKLPHGTTDA